MQSSEPTLHPSVAYALRCHHCLVLSLSSNVKCSLLAIWNNVAILTLTCKFLGGICLISHQHVLPDFNPSYASMCKVGF